MKTTGVDVRLDAAILGQCDCGAIHEVKLGQGPTPGHNLWQAWCQKCGRETAYYDSRMRPWRAWNRGERLPGKKGHLGKVDPCDCEPSAPRPLYTARMVGGVAWWRYYCPACEAETAEFLQPEIAAGEWNAGRRMSCLVRSGPHYGQTVEPEPEPERATDEPTMAGRCRVRATSQGSEEEFWILDERGGLDLKELRAAGKDHDGATHLFFRDQPEAQAAMAALNNMNGTDAAGTPRATASRLARHVLELHEIAMEDPLDRLTRLDRCWTLATRAAGLAIAIAREVRHEQRRRKRDEAREAGAQPQ